jgi:zinc transport system permease protein
MNLLGYGYMQRALIAALLIGLAAPAVGIYLVQRRLSLIGDGLGHVALAGVALGVVTGSSPIWVALVVAVVGAVVVELVRARGRASGDIALALLFYGGIAGGVVIISRSPAGTPANLNSYLFGAITTTTWADVAVFAALTMTVLIITTVLRRSLFAVSNDEEYALAAGMPVLRLNLLLAVLTAVTVVVSMRVVGLLLVSALMIVPVATAQVVARSFVGTLAIATAVGVVTSVGGVVTSAYTSTPSGGTIILLAIACFAVATLARAGAASLRKAR